MVMVTKSIFEFLQEMLSQVYCSSSTTHILLKPDLNEYLYVRHGLDFQDNLRCLERVHILGPGENIKQATTINMIFLSEEQTEQMEKSLHGFTPFNMIETYAGTPSIQLILYIPTYMKKETFEVEWYTMSRRVNDLVGILYFILKAYYRTNMIMDTDKKLFLTYAPIVIAMKTISVFFRYNTSKLVGVEVTTPTDTVLITQDMVDQVIEHSIKELLVFKAVNEIIKKN